METLQIQTRITQLEHAMEIEAGNNFPNGDLWNNMADKITMLRIYGQETMPDNIEGEGMSIYNCTD